MYIEDAGYTAPSLSTIASDKGGIARLCVDVSLRASTPSPVPITLPRT
jgi:hypothetical protein